MKRLIRCYLAILAESALKTRSERTINKVTYGERLFEQYLRSHGIRFEREPSLPGVTKLIDFVVDHAECGKILLEVKDIENAPPRSGVFDNYWPIRNKIRQGARKFNQTPDYVCVLVIAEDPGNFVQLDDPSTMLGAMYGDVGVRVAFDPEREHSEQHIVVPEFTVGKGEMIRAGEDRNTRIAAVITIREFKIWHFAMRNYINTDDGRSRNERTNDVQNGKVDLPDYDATLPGVTVWENAVASRKLPKDLFRGEMDAWWEVVGDRQLPTYIGRRHRDLAVDKYIESPAVEV